MTGMFNVYNAMTAAALGMIAGATMDEIQRGARSRPLGAAAAPRCCDTDTPYQVILDYSHAPAALENILSTVREFAKGPR